MLLLTSACGGSGGGPGGTLPGGDPDAKALDLPTSGEVDVEVQTDAGADDTPIAEQPADVPEVIADADASPPDADVLAPDADVLVPDADAAAADSEVPQPDAQPDEVPEPLEGFGVLSLNLHCLKTSGTSFSTNAARFEAIAERCADEDVAVVLVQEACEDAEESAMELLAAALEAATDTAWSHGWGFAHTGWAGTPDEADEGVGVLVRGALSQPQALVHAKQAGLQRTAMSATLPPELGGLRVTSVHFDHQDAAARLGQARETANHALAMADPGLDVLIAGDFNAKPGTAPHQALLDFGYVDLSASLDAGRIDHVFVHRATGWRADEAKLVFTAADPPAVSDHPGVLVRLVPAPPEAAVVTRLTAANDPGAGHFLAVRGDTAPLDWDSGWPAQELEGGAEWRLIVTEWADGSAFEYKFLRDDTQWMTGDNATGTAGADHTVTPAF